MMTTPSECAIPECPNGCYVDEYGKIHDCCGYNHAMEYQRRLALQNGHCLVFSLYNCIILFMHVAIGNNIIKGITHCLLQECSNLAWPFENYCGRTHAGIGKQRGLIR